VRRFVTFEGIEGSGKTTQIQLLSTHLEERGVDHVLTREPGGTTIGDQVRRLVLCDRFTDATLAYQGYGRGLPIDLIEKLHALQALALVPDLTLLFDLDPAAALERARRRDISKTVDETRFEALGLEFHERVRSGYLELARREPGRFVSIDARGAAAEVQARVQAAVAPVL